MSPSLRPALRDTDADAGQRRAVIVGCVLLAFVFTGIGVPFAVLVGVPSAWRIVFAPAFGALMGWLIYKIAWTVVQGTARAALSLVQPSGKSTPYEKEFSAHQALVASGELDEAFAAYERTIAQQPDNAEIRRQAVELHFRQGDPRRAEALLLELRRNPVTARSHELYATQRLVDLYLGALGDKGRALVELRRLVERFPDTPESTGARQAIASLKSGEP